VTLKNRAKFQKLTKQVRYLKDIDHDKSHEVN
jgi:hypothetical protein